MEDGQDGQDGQDGTYRSYRYKKESSEKRTFTPGDTSRKCQDRDLENIRKQAKPSPL